MPFFTGHLTRRQLPRAKSTSFTLVEVTDNEQDQTPSVQGLHTLRARANYIRGDADVSCTARFRTTLLGVVIHMCRRHAAPTQAQVRLY